MAVDAWALELLPPDRLSYAAALTLTLTRTPTLTPTLTLTLTCARGGGEERGGYLRDLDVGDRLAVAREGGGALLGGGGDRVAQPREPLG